MGKHEHFHPGKKVLVVGIGLKFKAVVNDSNDFRGRVGIVQVRTGEV